MIQMIYLAAGQ